MSPKRDTDSLPVRIPHQLGIRQLFVFASFFVFLITPGMAASFILSKYVFHLSPSLPVRDDPNGTPFMISLCACILIGGWIGKYLWILSMSRCLQKADVSPMLAYGIPRRLSRFDTKLLHRFYRVAEVKDDVT